MATLVNVIGSRITSETDLLICLGDGEGFYIGLFKVKTHPKYGWHLPIGQSPGLN